MKFLKKQMVQKVLELAQACPPTRDFTPEEIQMGIESGGRLPVDPRIQAYKDFLSEIGEQARGELTALLWLGRDQARHPNEWDKLVAESVGSASRDLHTISKLRIGQYVRHGMERLARAQKAQRAQTNGKIVVKKGRANPASLDSEDKRALVAGRYVLDAFRNQYGDQALDRLAQVMMASGYTLSDDERRLFGLSEHFPFDQLEDTLVGK